MKTLKKTLCLVLAMVMVFGLCAVSASAKLVYTDNDDINYKEAVDVMSGIGILAGDSRGFRPADTITRAEAAKIIAYILVGNAAQADALKASSDPFPDVPASHWAAGYISYCAASGIILGKGDGYHPNENVKGLEFATMLLRALGYGKQNEYTGADWSIYASRDALRYGIFDGNIAGANLNPATREECALYAFNTITGPKKVSYSSLLGNYIVTGTTLGEAADANKGEKFADDFKLGNTKKDGDEFDEFGRVDGYYWYVNKKSNRVTDYYVNGDKLKETYTTGVTGADLYNAIGSSFIKDTDAEDIEVYINSAKVSVFSDAVALDDDEPETNPISYDEDTKAAAKWEKANFAKGKTEDMFGTGNGVETYVYAWTEEVKDSADVNHIRICIVDTYLAKVTKVTEASATKDAKTEVVFANDDMNDAVTDGYETEEFEVDDYVLVTVADGKIQSMIPADVKEAEITRYTNTGSKKITAGGVQYEVAKENTVDEATEFAGWNSASAINQGYVKGKDYNLYLDSYGYLIAVDEIIEDSAYAYVAQFGIKTGKDTDLTDKTQLTADIYYADGTNNIVYIDPDCAATLGFDKTEASIDILNGKEEGTEAVTGIYKISTSKGKTVLDLEEEVAKEIEDVVNVQRRVAKITDSIDADTKTVYFYVTTDKEYNKSGWSVKAYTGFNNIPTTKKDDTATPISAIAGDDGIAKALLIDTNVAPESDDIVYLLDSQFVVEKVGNKYNVTFKGYALEGDDIGKVVDICTKSYDEYGDAHDKAVELAGKDGSLTNTFVTVKGDLPEPVAETVKESDKVWYIEDATMVDVLSKVSIKVSEEETEFGYGLDDGVKIVDLSKNSIKTATDIKTAMEITEGVAAKDVTVAFKSDNANQISILFVISVDDAESGVGD